MLTESGRTPDTKTYNAVISTCARAGQSSTAKEARAPPPLPPAASPASAAACSPAGLLVAQPTTSFPPSFVPAPPLQILDDMRARGVQWDHRTVTSLLNACAATGDADFAEQIYAEAKEADIAPNEFMVSALMRAHTARRYGSSRERKLETARRLLEESRAFAQGEEKVPPVVYDSYLTCMVLLNEPDEALRAFAKRAEEARAGGPRTRVRLRLSRFAVCSVRFAIASLLFAISLVLRPVVAPSFPQRPLAEQGQKTRPATVEAAVMAQLRAKLPNRPVGKDGKRAPPSPDSLPQARAPPPPRRPRGPQPRDLLRPAGTLAHHLPLRSPAPAAAEDREPEGCNGDDGGGQGGGCTPEPRGPHRGNQLRREGARAAPPRLPQTSIRCLPLSLSLARLTPPPRIRRAPRPRSCSRTPPRIPRSESSWSAQSPSPPPRACARRAPLAPPPRLQRLARHLPTGPGLAPAELFPGAAPPPIPSPSPHHRTGSSPPTTGRAGSGSSPTTARGRAGRSTPSRSSMCAPTLPRLPPRPRPRLAPTQLRPSLRPSYPAPPARSPRSNVAQNVRNMSKQLHLEPLRRLHEALKRHHPDKAEDIARVAAAAETARPARAPPAGERGEGGAAAQGAPGRAAEPRTVARSASSAARRQRAPFSADGAMSRRRNPSSPRAPCDRRRALG